MTVLLALFVVAASPLAEPFATLTLSADETRECTAAPSRRCEFARVDAGFVAYRALSATNITAKRRARDELAHRYRALFDETARGPAKKGTNALRNSIPIVDEWTIAASCRIAEVSFDYADTLRSVTPKRAGSDEWMTVILDYDSALHDIDKALSLARKNNVVTPYTDRCRALRALVETARAELMSAPTAP